MINITNNTHKIKIMNVGQGDSFILSPTDCCIYNNTNIFIDVGDGKRDVFKYNNSNELILLLSHSHKDHIGGLTHFFHKYSELLNEIWLPMYYDEICIITSFILELRGIQRVSNDNGNYIMAKNVVYASYLIDYLSKSLSKPIHIIGLFEGNNLCEHIKVFNPPISPESILGVEKDRLNEYIFRQKDEHFTDFKDWFPRNNFNYLLRILSEEFNEDRKDYSDENIPNDIIPRLIEQNENRENRRRFIYGMFYILKEYITNFIERPNNANFNKIYNKVKLTSNNASVVFKYIDKNQKNSESLFTGDAGKEVFNRLIKDKMDIKSEILKIPHHGSKKNINKTILKYIHPSLAIISHNNALFGKQRDPHPNREVIKMLDSLKVQTIYTNDVIKNKVVMKKKPDKSFVNNYIEYIDI